MTFIGSSGSFAANFAMMKICVLTTLIAIGTATNFDPKEHKNWNLLPHDICGQVSSSRIIGGKEAPMNAYPWIARIGYYTPKSRGVVFRCGGVVVNSKFVVTAAHCVANLPKGDKVATVRLGEHNIKTDPDCEGDFCADPVVDITPSGISVPENYNRPLYKHDIALVRLSEDIQFSASIKPICFPSGELLQKNYTGSMAEIAGWGIYNIDRPRSSVKLQVVKLPIVSNEECKKHLPIYSDLGLTQMCAGGIIGKDSCGGDSGGPLMKVDDGIDGPRYYLLGVVSFGAKKCARSPMPGVYTKMSAYMEWLLDNLNS